VSLPPPASGVTNVRWSVGSTACAQCVTVVSLDDDLRLQVVVVEGHAFSIFAAQTKPHEWPQARALIEPLVDCTVRTGCDPHLPQEQFSTFAGDSACSTRVEGCDAPEVEQAREHLRALVRRYLPEVGL
jgi:hypothetical protein